ncbi:acetylornithine aminotransferase [Pseudomonas syringae]|uniref:Acetylornithine aminotransferase n=1 Tax=Pseudomonas syringae TaxID=317 RepID=A0A1C7ZA96_PSESX|nr:aminotransferase class III-fold pyridoxal phosphate-dependent enzyme [Pseudomonas syringae]OCR26773.1 acetylornithine aminotransferase [Pseudomonas syringae]
MNLFRLLRNNVDAQELPCIQSVHVTEPEERKVSRPDHCDPVFVRGQGSWMWDAQGRVYLDFMQAGAANSLGHSPAVLLQALNAQAQTLISPGPGHSHRSGLELARRLCLSTRSDQAWFFSSASQACEGAIELARKWGEVHRGGAGGVITASLGMHATAVANQVPFNDLGALHAAVDAQTVAIMLEPIQSQAGVIAATHEYLQGVEKLCRELGILLILDETQTGIGRCGSLLCEVTYGVRADIVVLGEGLGGGVPLAALLARGTACCIEAPEFPGAADGNALMIAAGLTVLHSVQEPQFLRQVRDCGEHMREGLTRLAQRFRLGEVRGQGLLWGLSLEQDRAAQVVAAAQSEGLLIDAPQPDCLRFSPALTVSQANVDEMLQRLARALSRVKTAQLKASRGLLA